MDVSGTGSGMNEFIKKRVDFLKLSDSFYTIFLKAGLLFFIGLYIQSFKLKQV